MEKMIKVINDNLRTVINGIKTHKSATENSLTTIQGKIDERVKLAGEYRLNVDDARQIISSLENEISTLENDLNDLKSKFNSKDFKEILVVGSKEINNKILEKKSLIAKQSQRIIVLTDKAHKLKNELIALKEKKLSLEATLEKDNILEAFYESRIFEVIQFSEEHANDLHEYIDLEPQTALMTSTSEVENIDITSVIDGSIFEEIDEINNATDSDDLSEYINGVLDEGTIDLSDLNIDDNSSEHEEELFMTQELDDIISQANDLLEKSKNIEESITEAISNDSTDDSDDSKNETIKLDDVSELSSPLDSEDDEIEISIDEDDEDGESTDGLTLSLNGNDDETFDFSSIEDEIIEVSPYQAEDIEEEIKSDSEYEEELLNSADTSDIFPEVEDILQETPANGEIGAIGELNLTAPEDLVLDEIEDKKQDSSDLVDEENMFSALAEFGTNDENLDEVYVEEDPLQNTAEVSVQSDELSDSVLENDKSNEFMDVPAFDVEDNAQADTTLDVRHEIDEANLDTTKFTDEDIATIAEKYSKNNIVNIVYTMRKHNIAIAKIYDCKNVLANMSSENLDYVLTLLEKTNASSDSISYVFGMLDKVDIYKLEEKLSAKTNYELSELLYGVIPYEGEADIATRLNLNPSEITTLTTNASNEEYEMINQFIDIFDKNYNELKKYNVSNLNECITKHPHRFLFNPDNFASILDKYDADDLTRCVNKNAAVIDKL